MDCGFNPYGFFLTPGGGNYAGIPNHPNYRLGPIDGSGCDTLGIDNIPVAYFRYDTSETDPLDFEFTDLSYFEPATWTWDFGDGVQSNEQNPGHTFVSPGAHEVCLEVSNTNGSDSFCRSLYIISTATEEVGHDGSLHIYPNPARNAFWVSSVNGIDIQSVRCYNTSGKLVSATENVRKQSFKVDAPQGNSMLIVEVILSDGSVRTTKIVVQE
jgi:PKD repeat protein